MKKLILLSVLAMTGCTDEAATRSTLDKSGYTDIVITGYSPWVCGDDDTYETGFRAKNPAGKIVEGTVCCGALTKGCTVRF